MSSDRDALAVPSAWVRRFAHLVPRGTRVLDLASGGGRHARFFAGRGHPVTAIDRTLDGMHDLAGHPTIDLMEADLEAAPWPFAERSFGGIVVCRYLHRPLLPLLAAALIPGGALLYDTFAVGNEAYGRPSDPRFLLRPGELIEAYRQRLTIVAYEHGLSYAPRPAVTQSLAAVASSEPQPL